MTTAPNAPVAVRIATALADRIIKGEIEAGSRLRQDHIAEEFRASHVPVREAFRRLEAQGLVTSEPRRGVRVATFSRNDVREVAEMRASLEVLALKRAAPNMTLSVLNQAEDAIREGDRAKDIFSWEDANRRFHRTILTPCNMPRLLRSIDDLHAVSARFLFSGWQAEWETGTDRDHRAILHALRHRDIETAAATLGRHVLGAGRRSRQGARPIR